MAEKIGELLIQEGLITQSELEEALKAQVIYGGKLGTNLVEMGLLSEDDFGRVLGKMLRVPYVGADELREIPPAVIAAMPSDLAEKYKAVPLRLENRRLTLVMADPSDLRVMDEISFRTGFLIRPVVTSELALAHALEKHYGVVREIRYIALHRTVPTVRKKPVVPTPPAVVDSTGSAPSMPPLKSPPRVQPTEKVNIFPERVVETVASPPPLPPASSAAASDAPPALTVPSAALSPEPPPIDIFAEISAPETVPVTLEAVAQRLVAAVDREDIAAAAIGWLGTHFKRCALFLVRGEMATGWHAASAGEMVADFGRLRIPLSEPSALKTVADSRSPVLGPLQRTPFNSELLQELGSDIPKTVLLLPLLMLGRITAILYLDGPDDLLREKMPEVQKLCAKMIMAFEILMLKNKIMQL